MEARNIENSQQGKIIENLKTVLEKMEKEHYSKQDKHQKQRVTELKLQIAEMKKNQQVSLENQEKINDKNSKKIIKMQREIEAQDRVMDSLKSELEREVKEKMRAS